MFTCDTLWSRLTRVIMYTSHYVHTWHVVITFDTFHCVNIIIMIIINVHDWHIHCFHITLCSYLMYIVITFDTYVSLCQHQYYVHTWHVPLCQYHIMYNLDVLWSRLSHPIVFTSHYILCFIIKASRNFLTYILYIYICICNTIFIYSNTKMRWVQ